MEIILHAWCWSFNTIKENLQNIKDAGYTAVQTSPVQECKKGGLTIGDWWHQYQPTGYNIGNYQIGTEEEFIELCDVANNIGIKIIVDCVFNHMTTDWDQIDDDLKVDGYFRTNDSIKDWNNRYELTQKSIGGLWEVNTGNIDIQSMCANFVAGLLRHGIYGVRYDMAKHIELPDDNGFGSDFWDIVTINDSFRYGEIINCDENIISRYSKYMDITNSTYGWKLREFIKHRYVNIYELMNNMININPNKTISWVESHDTFLSDDNESMWMTDKQIELGWAIIAARKSSHVLFFSRPVGAGGTSYDSRFVEKSKIGDRGSDTYMSPIISKINQFRHFHENDQNDQEYLDQYGNSCVLIYRGNSCAIVNLGDKISFMNNLRIKDGFYIEKITENRIEIKNGILESGIEKESVMILEED